MGASPRYRDDGYQHPPEFCCAVPADKGNFSGTRRHGTHTVTGCNQYLGDERRGLRSLVLDAGPRKPLKPRSRSTRPERLPFYLATTGSRYKSYLCGLVARIHGLRVSRLHERDGVFTFGYFPADGKGQASHDGRVIHLADHHSAGRIARGWDLELNVFVRNRRGCGDRPISRDKDL